MRDRRKDRRKDRRINRSSHAAGDVLRCGTPEHNPVLDDHIIYAVIMLGIATANHGYHLGLGRWWGKTRLVNKFPVLE